MSTKAACENIIYEEFKDIEKSMKILKIKIVDENGNDSIPKQAAPNSPFLFRATTAPEKVFSTAEMRSTASWADKEGGKPRLMPSTATNAGKNRSMTSPSPVAAAPPTEPSTYAPDPGIGESPTRLKAQYVFNAFLTVL